MFLPNKNVQLSPKNKKDIKRESLREGMIHHIREPTKGLIRHDGLPLFLSQTIKAKKKSSHILI